MVDKFILEGDKIYARNLFLIPKFSSISLGGCDSCVHEVLRGHAPTRDRDAASIGLCDPYIPWTTPEQKQRRAEKDCQVSGPQMAPEELSRP
mmetsp:Transcript_16175/g.32787  ORF Transcript_16175/g.32787 Transcript_16175/m.32787 type:complete len:92 (+) Transcript_16175:529-804(+)